MSIPLTDPVAAAAAADLPGGPNSNVLPFVGPLPLGNSVALLYEITLSPARSASDPHLPHPDGSFTILLTCPHWPDDTPFLPQNAAINAILAPDDVDEGRARPPLGDVVVVRHAPLLAEPADSGTRARLWSSGFRDISPADGPLIDGAVRWALTELEKLPVELDGWMYFVSYEAAERLFHPDGSRVFPIHWRQRD
ncbi:hypothetical protein C8F01DRAFT_1264315 [Mycena amicta]|nr:hypothetical protein C8F01DRAFT_1264315 [Mycena amicta]